MRSAELPVAASYGGYFFPQTVLFEAIGPHFWASKFSTILRPNGIGILGKEGFLSKLLSG
jgi:hypothetical protein